MSLHWTYGAEHELADWDQRRGLPDGDGWGTDRKDVTMVNSNGIAVDPKGRLYPFGGEVNTPPTDTTCGQIEMLRKFILMHPTAKVNYRSNLHIHIRVPELIDDLEALKRIAMFNRRWLCEVLPIVEPIPVPEIVVASSDADKGAVRRHRRRKVSHHTTVTYERVNLQQEAGTVEEFFACECPRAKSDGRPLWHLAPRAAVNLRQLRDTDTIEFRHFPGTLNEDEFLTCLRWCRDYLSLALGLNHGSPIGMYRDRYADQPWPSFPKYNHDMELIYRRTTADGTATAEERREVIRSIDPMWRSPS